MIEPPSPGAVCNESASFNTVEQVLTSKGSMVSRNTDIAATAAVFGEIIIPSCVPRFITGTFCLNSAAKANVQAIRRSHTPRPLPSHSPPLHGVLEAGQSPLGCTRHEIAALLPGSVRLGRECGGRDWWKDLDLPLMQLRVSTNERRDSHQQLSVHI